MCIRDRLWGTADTVFCPQPTCRPPSSAEWAGEKGRFGAGRKTAPATVCSPSAPRISAHSCGRPPLSWGTVRHTCRGSATRTTSPHRYTHHTGCCLGRGLAPHSSVAVQETDRKVLDSLGSFDGYVREHLEGAAAAILPVKGAAVDGENTERVADAKGWLEVRASKCCCLPCAPCCLHGTCFEYMAFSSPVAECT